MRMAVVYVDAEGNEVAVEFDTHLSLTEVVLLVHSVGLEVSGFIRQAA